MKRAILVLLKVMLVFVLITGVLLGFSMLERGALAEHVARYFGWNWLLYDRPAEPVPGRPAMSSERDGWLQIDPNSGRAGVNQPGKNVEIYGEVIGDVQARNVRLITDASVSGMVTASETVEIMESRVQGKIKAKRVKLQENEMFSHTGQPSVRVDGGIEAEQVSIGRGSVVYGPVGGEQSQVDVAGHVRGEVKGSQILIRQSAVIEGDVYVNGSSVILEAGADVKGRLIGKPGVPLQIINTKATTSDEGMMNHEAMMGPHPVHHGEPHVVREFDLNGGWGWAWIPLLLGVIALSFLVYTFLRKAMDESRRNMTEIPWRALWTGFLTVILSIPVMFLLSVSIIGIPFALAVLIALVMAGWTGLSALALEIGQRIFKQLKLDGQAEWKSLVLGVLVVAHLVWVPVVGWVLSAGLLLLAIGSTVIDWMPRIKGYWSKWRKKGKPEEEEGK
ncbi:polymer-forming cytoskeletal protein [Lihuaxuella thermophila]|uniref:Protein CcmA, bactofilin family n=1 Tax=Lihuaxuella thermophila TaxID=1173111 RepID=A0A1H8G4B5_9BACL|nr:polymer-forming cytoskeletal protein [Lihuaxuella thermophila]SEN38822.1 protein CcmA, bactofilin family [Lihuaxuella thermophila]